MQKLILYIQPQLRNTTTQDFVRVDLMEEELISLTQVIQDVNDIEKIFTDLSTQTALLIGTGEMIELSAKHLSKRGVKSMIFANRTLENAQSIANMYDAEAITLKSLSEHLYRADIVISSTAAPIPIIGKGLIETVLIHRKHQPMLLIDLAIPRDIEPEANQLEDVFLYTVDDLQQVADSNLEERIKEKSNAGKRLMREGSTSMEIS